MQARVGSSPGTEFNTALGEIEKIAWLRLQDALNPS
jgi:2-oxo-4-hydroxy-4-carboxy--5-ureidoimidazoline (OHCU) decarboxylase